MPSFMFYTDSSHLGSEDVQITADDCFLPAPVSTICELFHQEGLIALGLGIETPILSGGYGAQHYLLYMSTSGFHSLWGGIRMSPTSPYSDLFHCMLTSLHSCKTTVFCKFSANQIS